MELKCSICGKEKVTLIVPPDKPVYYCLRCIHDDLSKNWQLPEEAKHVVRIVNWLEQHGHIIPEAPITLGKPLRVTVEPRPKLKKPKRQKQ